MAIVIEREIECVMRDGCVLRANVYRPAEPGLYPTLLFRTPYDKNVAAIQAMALDPLRMVEAGYVVVQQDTRGRGASDGKHSPWTDEFDDGADTLEWISHQSWSNGRVGAYGISYHGLTAWAAAASGAPQLEAISAAQAPCDHYDIFWRGGAFELGMHLHWTIRVMGVGELLRKARTWLPQDRAERLNRLIGDIDNMDAMARSLPLQNLSAAQPEDPYFEYVLEVLDQELPGEFHAERSVTGKHGAIVVPALITAGWHDVLLRSDLAHYQAMRDGGGSAKAREESRLVIGPWTHGPGMHQSVSGELDFGVRASGLALDLREDLTGYHRRWFDRWLKDTPDHGFAPVRLFVMGRNHWRDESEWPLARSIDTRWYMHGDAGLSPVVRPDGGATLTYRHDPDDPCPTLGGSTLLPLQYAKGPVRQNALRVRDDVLSFTSDVLTQEIEVTGYVRVSLWASTSARDADWIVKLCDVHPDGDTFTVCDGIVRASRRGSRASQPQPLTPDEIVLYDIDLLATSMVFLPGHRLCVMVMSSDFPRYDRNPGTGGSSLSATRLEVATQSIYCDGAYPSHIILPIIPPDGGARHEG